MAIDSLINGRSMGKFKMVPFGTVCRSVWNHPFIVAVLFFLICLYRYLPSLFYLLLSASPVVVCTAVLLGALLIHGQPNNHKLEYPGEICNTTASLRTGAAKHSSSGDKDGIFSTDRFAEVRKDIVTKGINDLPGGVGRVYHSIELSQGKKIHKGKSKVGFYLGEKDVQMSKDRVPHLAGREMLQEQNDAEDLPPDQQKQVDDSVDQESDSESDAADKSSLDALVSHIILTPQETLPLLDSEEPQLPEPSHVSLRSEIQSLDSNRISSDSDEETDSKDDEEEDESSDDDDDDDDEDVTPKGKDGEKSEISWTEDDNKSLLKLRSSEMEKNEHLENLIARINDRRDAEEEEARDSEEEEEEIDDTNDDDDGEEEEENLEMEKGDDTHVTMWTEEDEKNMRLVGNSELERNQRLENLLARRRAQRNFSMISERNLIDFEHPVRPFQITPISTTRANPFDSPSNTNPSPSVAPIPGSAPSVAVPRKNPFDSPSTSPKAAHNLTRANPKEEPTIVNHDDPLFHTAASSGSHNHMGDILRPGFADINRKEAVFRRYESFSPGYYFMGDAFGHDLMDVDRREATISRHESFSARSPFPGIFTPEKPRNFHLKPVFVPEQSVVEELEHPSPEKQSSQDSESTISSGSISESLAASIIHEDVEPDLETDLASETTTALDHASSHSENKSEPSTIVDPFRKDKNEGLVIDPDVKADSNDLKIEARTDDEHDTASSSSTSSGEDDRFSNTSKDEGEKVGEFGSSPKVSQDVSNVNHISTEEENNHVDPVYDTSPSSAEKNGPFSSIVAEI